MRRLTDFLARLDGRRPPLARIRRVADAVEQARAEFPGVAAAISTPRPRSARSSNLVREVNSAIDARELGDRSDRRPFARRSTSSTACLACCRCAGPRTSSHRCRWRRSSG